MIISANKIDAPVLTEIALTSKGFWNYSKENLNCWIDDLTVSEQMIQKMIVYKFSIKKEAVGFYILNQPKSQSIELEFLFVLPDFIGKGIGSQLIQHAFEKAASLQCQKMTLLADPNAVPFYSSKGFTIIDQKESSIVGRFLPIMQKELKI